MSDEEFDEADFPSVEQVAIEQYTKFAVLLYTAFKKLDLTVQESASLTAAILSHSMPTELKGPIDGS